MLQEIALNTMDGLLSDYTAKLTTGTIAALPSRTLNAQIG